jgi:hypothetical protein
MTRPFHFHTIRFNSLYYIDCFPNNSVVIHGSMDSSLKGWVMVFNATFSNISVISWSSVLLVEEANASDKVLINYF